MLEHRNQEPTAPARVVVLGASGFLGSALCARLRRAGLPTVGPSSREVDLTDPLSATALADLLKPGDAVVLLAIHSPQRGRGPETFVRNISMVTALSRALDQVEVAQLVCLSSDAVYSPYHEPIDEETRPDPEDLYGLAHLCRERLLTESIGAKLAVLRSTMIYGANDPHQAYGPNRFITTALRDGVIELFGEGEELREYMFLDDVVELIWRTLIRRSIGVMNLTSGQPISFADLAARVKELSGREVVIRQRPRIGKVMHRRFDSRQLRKAAPDWRPLTLAEGLQRTLVSLAT